MSFGAGDLSIKKEGNVLFNEGRKEMFYLMKEGNVLFNDASTHFIYGYMASGLW